MVSHSFPRLEPGRIPRRSALLAAAALALVPALAACGSGGAGGVAAGSNRITVLRSSGAVFEPLYIAEQQGYFKDAGLDVTIKEGAADTAQNAPSVLNGEAQFAMTDGQGFLKAAVQGLPVRATTSLQSSNSKTKATDGLLVKPDSPIKSFKDLEGKTVGMPSLTGSVQFICEYLVKQAGGDPSKVNYVALPTASLNDSVQSGKIDAAYTFASFFDAGKQAGLRAMGNGMNELLGYNQGLLFASQSYLQANGDTAKKFIDAVAKGIDYANSHPDAVRAVDKQYTKLSADYIDKAPVNYYDKTIYTGVMTTTIQMSVQFGLLSKAPDEKNLYWDKAPTAASAGN
ncbi:hypothetical protein GCM10017566_04780 [Amycolatopsis bartoniae]|uniref:SsuA/THI5-like domain-containing protein n=1 Tax=Amycolatopsis bartoniae TaxID=941986 RepID=A0A8H9IN91_9PSEU|nr:hypothetical protein GCM10017566_04780 [Amycolatopsis bartoniae]